MRAECYRNLHKRGISIRALEGPSKGRVIGVETGRAVDMVNVVLIVQPAGHRRVIESGVKNVHAFVRGTLLEPGFHETLEQERAGQCFALAFYNPFKAAVWRARDPLSPALRPVFGAASASIYLKHGSAEVVLYQPRWEQ